MKENRGFFDFSKPRQAMKVTCTGVLALSALFCFIEAFRLIAMAVEYAGATPSIVIYVVSSIGVGIGCGLAAFDLFVEKNVVAGYLVSAICFLIRTIWSIVIAKQDADLSYGSFGTGFWRYNLFTIISYLLITGVFILLFITAQKEKSSSTKSIGIIVIAASVLAFVFHTFAGGEYVTLSAIYIISFLLVCGGTALLPFAYGYIASFKAATATKPAPLNGTQNGTDSGCIRTDQRV